MAQILVYDAFKLLELQTVMIRWILAMAVLLASIGLWYAVRTGVAETTIRRLLGVLIATDILVIGVSVYLQRGMASKAVLLFAIPILTAAAYKTKAALFATTTVAAVTYFTAAILYFGLNFNEGYKIELYGETAFSIVVLFLVGSLTWALIRNRK